MKTKTDYITITNNDFKIENINNKITLESAELDLIGAADGDSNTKMGYITISPSQFKLAHNNTTISGELDLGFSRVSCNDLDVLNKTTSYDLEVKNELIVLVSAAFSELDAHNATTRYLSVINNANLPKINTRP